MVRQLRGGGRGGRGSGQASTFDARTILNITKRLRGSKQQTTSQGRRPIGRGRGGLWTSKNLSVGRPTPAVKTLVNFTVVAPAPSTPSTRKPMNQRTRIQTFGGAQTLTRTIENSRVTVSGGGVSKTIMNPNSARLSAGRQLRTGGAYDDLEVESITRRVANTGTFAPPTPTPSGRRLQFAGGRTTTRAAPSAMFISAMREAQSDQTPYEPSDVSMEDVQSSIPLRTSTARARLGPPPQQTSAAVKGVHILLTNLASSVTNDDVEELCSSVPGLVQSRLIEPGLAQAVYSTRRAAQEAINLYDKRELDGVPMRLHLTEPEASKSSSLSIKKDPEEGTLPALRQKLKAAPAVVKQEDMMVDRDLITSALFPQKKGQDTSGVTFTVKI